MLLIHFSNHPTPALRLSKMKHPIWGPICWKILSRLMHVHKPVFYAKALTTPSWPICSLFIYPIFCLSSISLSLVLWQHVSHHISVGCLDLSHWCLSHKRMLMSVPFVYCMRHPFEHLSPTVFSKAYCNCPTGTFQWKYSCIICWTCPVQHPVTAMYKGDR